MCYYVMKLCRMAALGVLAALALGSAARADWTLINGDFAQQKALTVNTWNVSEGLSVTDAGKLLKVPTRNVLALTSDRPRAAAVGGGAAWRLALRNGDVLYGEPGAISGQSLEFKATDAGTVAVPLKLVAAIIAMKRTEPGAVDTANLSRPAGAADKDVIHLKNGDTLDGLVVNVDAQKLQIAVGAADAAPTDIEMARVDRL